jgi:hypothetical protein
MNEWITKIRLIVINMSSGNNPEYLICGQVLIIFFQVSWSLFTIIVDKHLVEVEIDLKNMKIILTLENYLLNTFPTRCHKG